MALLVVGCSSKATEAMGGPDAGSIEPLEVLTRALPHALPSVAANGGLRNTVVERTEVTLPARADQSIRLADKTLEGAVVEVTALDLAPIPASPRRGVRVFAAAAPGTDVVLTTIPGGFEESRVIHTGGDALRVRYAVALGPALVTLRKVGESLEALDKDGVVRLGSAAPFAVDARGRKRRAHLSLTGTTPRYEIELRLDTRDLAFPIVLDPVWTLLTSMSTPRRQHVAWLLSDGKVLVAGGHFDEDYRKLSTAETFAPTTGAWTATSDMSITSAQSTGFTLSGKRVLVGGYSDAGYNLVSQVFNEATRTWSSGPNTLASYIVGAGAALSASGSKALLAGGEWSSTAAEVFDLSATSTDVGPLPSMRGHSRAVLLKDGRVLVVGQVSSTLCDIYDPVAKKWSPGPVGAYTYEGSLTALDDGSVLLAGGSYGGATAHTSAWIWDGIGTTWKDTAPLGYARARHEAVKLASGRVLVVGGVTDGNYPPDVEMFDPATGKWSLASRLSYGRVEHTVTLLGDGRVVVAGGLTDYGITSTAEVFAPLPLGSLCKTDGECPSGPCVDGVCCNATCLGACERCNDPSSAGTCVKTAPAPLPLHATCGAYSVCTAGACATSCTSDTQCSSAYYCAGGACVAKLAKGKACTATNQCTTGFCVDGVCCDRACGGQCEACDIPGKDGSCAPTKGAPHGTRTACSATPGDVCASACDGSDSTKCHLPSSATPCGADTCGSGKETHASLCDGAGKCGDTPKPCGAYACDATKCKTSCKASDECAAGYWCNAGSCAAREALGTACTGSAACGEGLFCTDGVCCGVGTCGAGAACSTAAIKGECRKLDGVGCAADTDCGSGKCVDGVCCDKACDGQCEACDVPGSAGKCAVVKGTPHGKRTTCAPAGADPCSAGSCDGVDRSKCVGTAGKETPCRAQSCKDGTLTEAASCVGTGACPVLVQSSCGAYACDAGGKACRTRCDTATDCASGYSCVSGACVRKAATCSDGKDAVVGADGVSQSCTPYVCREDKCLNECTSSADCALGTLCDISSKICREPTPPSAVNNDGGGCTIGGTGRSPAQGGWLFLALGVVALRGRRRALAALGIAAAPLLGCGRAAPTEPDAGVAPITAATPSRAFEVVAALRREPLFAARFAAPEAKAWTASSRLDVTLPSTADTPLRLAVHGDPDVWLEVTREGSTAVHGADTDGARVHLDAALDTDVVHLAGPNFAEEVRVVRSPRAPLAARYRVRKGPAVVSVRIVDGRVIAAGAGASRIESEPMFAVDARSSRRAVSVRWVDEAASVFETSLDTKDLAYPVAIDPAWTAAGTTADWHLTPYVHKLGDGTVLAAGGGNGKPLVTETYNPTTATWTLAPPLPVTHDAGVSGRLVSGDAIVALGYDTSSCSLSAHVFRRATRTWQARADAPSTRRLSASVVLDDGRFMVIGGTDCGTTTAAALTFNDSTNAWATVASMSTVRWQPTAVKLTDGRVLVSGGYLWSGVATALSSAEIYNPTSNTWTAAANMSTPRYNHTMTRMADGRILTTGGERGFLLGITEIYDPNINVWIPAPPMNVKRARHGAILLNSGRVLVAMGSIGAGYGTTTSEVFDPTRGAWLDAGPVTTTGIFPVGMDKLDDGKVLLTAMTARLYAEQGLGIACTVAGECASGYCTDGVCCGTASCPTGTACNNKTKPGSCAKLNGMACAAGSECASDLCVDAVCCDKACTGQCEACDVAGLVGTCSAVTGQSHGARPACDDGVADPCQGTKCDGADRTACKLAPAGTVGCGAATCKSGVETHLSTCNGAGKCSDAPKGCGIYACGATACLTTCASSADCVAGYYCKASTCVPTDGLGAACSDGGSCSKGLFCTDGVCCGVSTCGAGASCATVGKLGRCMKTLGAACGIGDECASGLCVDGVCCDRACDGQCEACDADKSVGTCTTVKGAPHGARTACPSGGTEVCARASCDGADAAKCAELVGSAVECKPGACKDGVATAPATCDGKGACGKGAETKCVGFACDPVAKTCRLGCGSKDDCLAGFICRSGKCVERTDECAPNGSAVIKADGTIETCAPLVCKAGACVKACAATADCVVGYVCDDETKTCVEPAAPAAADSGGCALRPRTETSWGLALLVTLGVLRRRRRAP